METVVSSKQNPLFSMSLYVMVMCVYFLCAPFEDIFTGTVGSLAKYLALAGVGAIFLYFLFGWLHGSSGRLQMKTPNALLFVLPLWMILLAWLSFFWASDPDFTFSRNIAYSLLPLLFLALFSVSYSAFEYSAIKICVKLGGIACAGYLTTRLQFSGGLRLSLTEGNDPNNLASLLLLPAVLLLCDALKEKRIFWRVIQYAFFGYISAILVATGSRGGLLAFFVAVICSVVVSGVLKNPLRFLAIVLVVVVLGIIVLSVLPPEITQRMFSLDSYKQVVDSPGQRGDIWRKAIVYILPDLPFYGYGSGNASSILGQFYGHSKGVHNTYLEMLIEYGVLGLPVFLWFLGEMLSSLRKKKSVAELSALIGMLVVIFFLGSYAKKFFWNVLYLGAIFLKTDFNEIEIQKEKTV